LLFVVVWVPDVFVEVIVNLGGLGFKGAEVGG
jgi:hypothetical protein